MVRNIVFLTVLFFTKHCFGDVFIATSSDFTGQQAKAVSEFRNELGGVVGSAGISERDVSQLINHSSNNDIIIAPGRTVLSALLRGAGSTPVIGIFISPESCSEVTARVHPLRTWTAVYSTPSPRRQLALAKALFGVNASVGVLTTSSVPDPVLTATAEILGISLQFVQIEPPWDFSHSIKGIKRRLTGLLLSKDKALFERLPLDRLILMAYEISNLGVIGYSRGVVNNGGIATTYASVRDTAQSIAVLLHDPESLPPPGYPGLYSVAVNRYVMRSLGIPEKSPEALKQEITLILSGKEGSGV